MKFWRNCIIFSATSMLLLGMLFIVNPFEKTITITGIVMIVSGLFQLANYLNDQHDESDIKWILADGIVNFLLGAILFINNDSGTQTFHFTFGAWLLFSGAIRVFAGLKAKKLTILGWKWIMTIGILTASAGAISFVKSPGLSIFASLFLIIESFNIYSTHYYLEKL